MQSLLVLLLIGANVTLNYFNQFSFDIEMGQRIEHIAETMSTFKPDVAGWQQQNYPHLHTPLSSSVALQWTLRNGSLVNLPWALLVEGDVILIKPGQVVNYLNHIVSMLFEKVYYRVFILIIEVLSWTDLACYLFRPHSHPSGCYGACQWSWTLPAASRMSPSHNLSIVVGSI